MAKATKKQSRTKPQLRAFVSCDAVSHDEGPSKGKVSLHGLFDAVYAEKFPGLFRPFFLFARLVGVPNGSTVEIRAKGVDGSAMGEPVPIKVTGAHARFQDVITHVGPVPLTAYGTITFDLFVDGRRLGWSCEITVQPKKGAK